MKKISCIALAIGSIIISTSSFADIKNTHPHAILDAMHTSKLSAMNKDEINTWLLSILMVGKKVEVQSTVSELRSRKGLSGSVLVPQAATNLQVTISDSHTTYRTINLGNVDAPRLIDFTWDGTLQNGASVSPGTYNISASAMINGTPTTLVTAGDFKVRSVAVDDTNHAILNVHGLGSVTLDDVIKVL